MYLKVLKSSVIVPSRFLVIICCLRIKNNSITLDILFDISAQLPGISTVTVRERGS